METLLPWPFSLSTTTVINQQSNALLTRYWLIKPLTKLALTLLCLGMSSLGHGFDEPPNYSVNSIQNGLNVSHFVKRDRLKISLYLVNHETFPIVCDAQYTSGPDKQDAKDKTLKADKAVAFKFRYGRNTNTVKLTYICIDPAAESGEDNNDEQTKGDNKEVEKTNTDNDYSDPIYEQAL